MNDKRKMFLLVWMPVLFFVSVGIFSVIGKPIDVGGMSPIGIIKVGVRLRDMSDVLVPFILVIVFSFLMYVMVGLDDVDKESVK
jgi:sensor histidine kinase regulating citrate/malate metabolism